MTDATAAPPGKGQPPLEVIDLFKHYGRVRAVDGISFRISPGELVGFIGPNGAGKSTTYRCIVGLQRPDSGVIRIAGVDVQEDRVQALKQMGYVGQDLDIYQYLTGEELLRLVGEIREMDPAVVESRIEELVTLLRLEGASRRLIRHYSGGMARKVAIAAALLPRPPLLLLDESFAGLDPESTRAIRDYLDARRDEGMAVLVASHVLDMLERWVSRVIVISRGRTVEDLDRADLDTILGDRYPTLTDLYLARTESDGAQSDPA